MRGHHLHAAHLDGGSGGRGYSRLCGGDGRQLIPQSLHGLRLLLLQLLLHLLQAGDLLLLQLLRHVLHGSQHCSRVHDVGRACACVV